MSKSSCGALLLALVVVGGCIPWDRAIFLPDRTDRYRLQDNHVPAELLEELSLTAADGVRLAAMLARREDAASAPTVLYLHGQASNIDDAWPDVQRLWDAGFNVLALDYRGYGRSDGEPTEAGLYLDAHAAFEAARADPRLDGARVVIWGLSLGSAVAAELALTAPAIALVLDAPFTSMPEVVESASPYAVPSDWVTDLSFDTAGRVGAITLPVVVARGADDRRFPAWMAEEVFTRANEPKRYVLVPGAEHSEVIERGLAAVLAATAEIAPGAVP